MTLVMDIDEYCEWVGSKELVRWIDESKGTGDLLDLLDLNGPNHPIVTMADGTAVSVMWYPNGFIGAIEKIRRLAGGAEQVA